MKQFINIFFVITFLLTNMLSVQAESIDDVIRKSKIKKANVSISVKNVHTNDVVYELNSHQPMLPASTLKLITLPASIDTLGDDYEFVTKLYKSNDELFLKLNADPFLRTKDLGNLLKSAKKDDLLLPKAIHIDASILDDNEWGEGWQWDDDLNVLMPKFSVYNLDGNLLEVFIDPTYKGSPAVITTSKNYPTVFMNFVTTGDYNLVNFSRNNSVASNIITAEGVVSKRMAKQVPVNDPKKYFIVNLNSELAEKNINCYEDYIFEDISGVGLVLLAEVSNPISKAIVEVFENSNNLVSETVFKLAGAKFADTVGTQKNSVEMVNNYLIKEGFDASDIKIVDGSGVSKNNIMTADFMSEFLLKQAKKSDFEKFNNQLPTAGAGTLKNRMLYFKNNIRAKTGTLSDSSAIAGYLTTQNGEFYAFDIMINYPIANMNDVKSLEEYILRAVYTNY